MKTENTLTDKEKILYCYNNDSTSLEEVVAWFNLYLGYDISQAVIMAYHINDYKRAAIYKGSEKEIETISKIFNNKGLKTTVE